MTVCAKQLWLYVQKIKRGGGAFMIELTNILGTFHDPVLNIYIFYSYRNLDISAFLAKSHFYDQD